ncbi:hypothetical protein EVAR_3245_1 [Eumeta japonica]|uniref:Uncharacterized protein n=1 Tax=Eumeta variegata TaxID=151549 RepID=A0A4C1SUR4_EUMVA|nr:hypothetical protein EVAR_3245_1 [Eumeta japonica]
MSKNKIKGCMRGSPSESRRDQVYSPLYARLMGVNETTADETRQSTPPSPLPPPSPPDVISLILAYVAS